jgi:signal transduction histidine kinase
MGVGLWGVLGVSELLKFSPPPAELERSYATIKQSEESLRYLTSQVISAQEQERKRVAMELHEGLAQSMTSLKLFLRAIQPHLPPKAVKIKEEFDGAHNLIIEMIEELRRISQGLSPTLLEDLGLTEAIKHLLKDLARYQKLTITEDIDDIRQDQTEINLFRVVVRQHQPAQLWQGPRKPQAAGKPK